MTKHGAPDLPTLRTLTPVHVLDVPLWVESHDDRNRTRDDLRSSNRVARVPVVLWPGLEVRGTVIWENGYAAVEWFIVLREWNPQVLLHELLHVILGHVLPSNEDGTGGHDVIGAVEVALTPFVTFALASVGRTE